MKNEKNKKNKWVKFRHSLFYIITQPIIRIYTRIVYRAKVKRFKGNKRRQYLILSNHQTPFDQFFANMLIRKHLYCVASEDLFSNGFVSRLMSFVFAPIPIKKQTTDPKAVFTCARVIKQGGSIYMAPEGNRTYSGKTEHINDAVTKLIKLLKIPVILMRIEGGYGVQPRWSDKVRRGKLNIYADRVLEPEEFQDLSDEQLFSIIQKSLFVNEAKAEIYKGNKRAEYLERAMYVCPYCGLAEFESNKNIIKCKKCGKEIEYSITKELKGIGFDFPFRFVNDWYEYQQDFISKLDLSSKGEKPFFVDTAKMSEVVLYDKKVVLDKNAKLSLFGDKLLVRFNDRPSAIYTFEQISAVTVLGRNKLNVYVNDKVYQFKGDKRFNALKYVNFYYHYLNLKENNSNGKFLGF